MVLLKGLGLSWVHVKHLVEYTAAHTQNEWMAPRRMREGSPISWYVYVLCNTCLVLVFLFHSHAPDSMYRVEFLLPWFHSHSTYLVWGHFSGEESPRGSFTADKYFLQGIIAWKKGRGEPRLKAVDIGGAPRLTLAVLGVGSRVLFFWFTLYSRIPLFDSCYY